MEFYFWTLCTLLLLQGNVAILSEKKVMLFDIRSLKLVTTIDERFLSFSLDSRLLAHHWKTLDLRNKKLIALTKSLTPAYLRVGGTDGDRLLFQPTVQAFEGCKDNGKNDKTLRKTPDWCRNHHDIISGQDIKFLGQFINATQTELVYGLNVLQRKNCKWDPTNSLQLINFMNKNGIPVSGFELGNEPKRFKTVYNRTITGKQLGKDFIHLGKLLKKLPRYANALILGPDITHIGKSTNSIKFLINFLRRLNNSTLSRATFHDYYFSGKNSTVEDFLDANLMDQFKQRIGVVKKVLETYNPSLAIWLGETSSAYGGGTVNVSNRFVATFMWLDKLGQSALSGIKVVVRQSLASPNTGSSNYGLIDSNNHPSPGFFVSYIFKKLVGRTVLTNILPGYQKDKPLNNHISSNNKLRLYVHCASSQILHPSETAIIIFGINVDDSSYKIKILSGRINIQIEEYLLTGNLRSKHCNLNGKRLKLGTHWEPPILTPKIRNGSFTILPKTLGFWVIRGYEVMICK